MLSGGLMHGRRQYQNIVLLHNILCQTINVHIDLENNNWIKTAWILILEREKTDCSWNIPLNF